MERVGTVEQQLPCALKAVASSVADQATSIRTRAQPVKTLLPSPAKISNNEAPTQSRTVVQCPAHSIHDMEEEHTKRRLKEEVQGPGLRPPRLMEDHLRPVFM